MNWSIFLLTESSILSKRDWDALSCFSFSKDLFHFLLVLIQRIFYSISSCTNYSPHLPILFYLFWLHGIENHWFFYSFLQASPKKFFSLLWPSSPKNHHSSVYLLKILKIWIDLIFLFFSFHWWFTAPQNSLHKTWCHYWRKTQGYENKDTSEEPPNGCHFTHFVRIWNCFWHQATQEGLSRTWKTWRCTIKAKIHD